MANKSVGILRDYKMTLKVSSYMEFPGIPVVRTRRFHCWGPGSIPDLETDIPQAAWSGKKQTNKQKHPHKNTYSGNETIKKVSNCKGQLLWSRLEIKKHETGTKKLKEDNLPCWCSYTICRNNSQRTANRGIEWLAVQ